MQDYYQEAFGKFDPQNDEAASAKFALSVLAMDGRFSELLDLLTDGHEVGALEGSPGWIIERRDSGPSGDMPGYARWPIGKNFRAYVDPDEFALGYPETFMETKVFYDYVRRLLDVSMQHKQHSNPVPDELIRIRALIAQSKGPPISRPPSRGNS